MRKPPPSGGFLFLRRLHLLAEVFWRVWICIRHAFFIRSLEATKSPRPLMLRALDLPLRQADLGGFGHLADDDEEGGFVEKFDQSTASMTLEALIIA